MRETKAEILVGLFALVVFAILAFITFKVGDFEFFKRDKGYRVYAYFRNAAGLYEGAPIKVAGVDAGILEKIELEDGRAKLTLRLDPDVKIYPDASAYIRASGLLGDKYLEIKVGTPQAVCCQDESVIESTFEIVDMDEVMKNISNVSMNLLEFVASFNDPAIKNAFHETLLNLEVITRDVRGMVSDNRENVQDAISNIESLAARLDALTAENSAAITNTIADLEALAASLRGEAPTAMRSINSAAEDVRAMVDENRGRIASLTNSASDAMASVQSIARKIDQGEGTIGRLVNDKDLYDTVNRAAQGLDKTLSAVDRFKSIVAFRGDYMGELKEVKGAFSLTLAPSDTKYYILGVVGDPLGRTTTTVTTTDGSTETEDVTETELEFTAHFARRYKDTALRVGFTESTFGVGFDQFVLDDKLQLAADVWDFSEKEAGADQPHLRVGLDYYVFKNLFLSGGGDNLLNEGGRGYFVGGGLRFVDEDLKYLLGTASRVSGF